MFEHDSTLNIKGIITNTETYALNRKTWKKYEKQLEKIFKALSKTSTNNKKRGK